MKRSNFIKSALLFPLVFTKINTKAEPKWNGKFEADKLQAGTYVTNTRNDLLSKARIGFLCTVTYQISYNYNSKSGLNGRKYTLTSVADGWTHGDPYFISMTKQELAQYLNLHGYRPTTRKEMLDIINYSKKNFYDNE
jgi:hypothetical protein